MSKITKRQLNDKLETCFKGIWIPKDIWLCEELTPVQMLVLMQIHSLDGKFGCKVSNEHISEFFGVHKNTISEHIQNLKEKNFIEISFKNGNPGDGERVIKCSKKFKLITAGLIEDIDNYKQNLSNSTSQENTEGGKENTDDKITLVKHLEEHKNIHNFSKKIISQFPDIENFISSNFKNPDVIQKYVNFINNRSKKHSKANLSLEICQEHILELKKCKDVDQAILFLQKAFDCGWQGLNLEWIQPKNTGKNTQKSIYITN